MHGIATAEQTNVVTTLARQPLGTSRHTLALALLTVGLSIGWFLLDGHLKINLADEGWLWYGAEAVRQGQVPMRDFAAYDPGRYFWVAGWSYILGESLVALRLACVFFQCFAVMAGLLVARRMSRNWLFLLCVALLLCAWMHPRFKLFEQSIALMAVYAGVLLIETPSLRRHWWVGVFGGLSAIIGRNHGAYHVVAFSLLIAWCSWGVGWRKWIQRSSLWAAGLLAGYIPQILMFVFVPGFFSAFFPYVGQVLASGSTNLAKAVAWPWLIRGDLPFWFRLAPLVEGWWYVASLVFLVAGLLRLAIGKWQDAPGTAPFVAALCVSIPYAHYVFSRPDIIHLAHGAPPAALGMIALAFTLRSRWRVAGFVLPPVLLAATLAANLFQIGISLRLFWPREALAEVDVRGETMVVGKWHAQILESARHVASDLAQPNEAILFLPHFPALYPFTSRRSPTKETYFVFPPDDAELLKEIETAGVQWVMLQDYALDERSDLRFRNTNPLVISYLGEQFESVPLPTLPRGTFVLHRRAAPAP